MNSSNPTLGAFNRVGAMGLSYGNNDTMSIEGTINKTGILGAILLLTFGMTWYTCQAATSSAYIFAMPGAIIGLILALVISFKPTTAPYLSPVYAAVEGVFLGAISLFLEGMYPGIALQAALLTFSTLFVMLVAYRTKLIVVNNTFRAVIVGATMSIFVYYLIAMGCSFFSISLPGMTLGDNSWLSIGIRLVIVVVAAMNLALDFDMISENSGNAPKYMEWYGGFALLVTLVWLYVEFLRLLAALRGRN